MSEGSDREITTASTSCETQTLDADVNREDNVEELSGLTFPSLLESHCSFPTELFYTLNPISLSQITSESTPIVNRGQPIGGEDRYQRNNLFRTFDIQAIDFNEEQVLQSL